MKKCGTKTTKKTTKHNLKVGVTKTISAPKMIKLN